MKIFEHARLKLKLAILNFLKSLVSKLEKDIFSDFLSGGIQKIEKVANYELRFVLFKNRSVSLYFDSIEKRDYYYEKCIEILDSKND